MDVKLDPPGLNNHNSGSGGGGKSAGGAEARVASLMDLNMCDFATMLVPCSIRNSLSAHLQSAQPANRAFWYVGMWSGAGYNTRFLFLHRYAPFVLMNILKRAKLVSKLNDGMSVFQIASYYLGVQQNTSQQNQITDAIKLATSKLLSKQRCKDFIEKSNFGKDGKDLGLNLGSGAAETISETVTNMQPKIDRVYKDPDTGKENTNISASTDFGGSTTLYDRFFNAPTDPTSRGNGNTSIGFSLMIKPTPEIFKAQVLIHEAAHQFSAEATDVNLANRLKDSRHQFSDSEQGKASNFLQGRFEKYCDGK